MFFPSCSHKMCHKKCTKKGAKKGCLSTWVQSHLGMIWLRGNRSLNQFFDPLCPKRKKKKSFFLGSSLNRFKGNLSMRFIDLHWLKIKPSTYNHSKPCTRSRMRCLKCIQNKAFETLCTTSCARFWMTRNTEHFHKITLRIISAPFYAKWSH